MRNWQCGRNCRGSVLADGAGGAVYIVAHRVCKDVPNRRQGHGGGGGALELIAEGHLRDGGGHGAGLPAHGEKSGEGGLGGEELRTAAEIDASVSDYMTTARLFISGMNFSYNPHRLILDRVTDLYLTGEDGGRMEVENDKLYQVVADLYSGQMLGAVTGMSYGLLSVVPRYEDGTPIEDFEDVIITENGKELKAWDAIARYMTSFPDTDGDGIPEIPVYYSTLHGRKVVEEGRSLSDLLRNPGRYAVMMAIAAAAFLLAAVLLIFLLTKAIRRRGRGIRRSRRGV